MNSSFFQRAARHITLAIVLCGLTMTTAQAQPTLLTPTDAATDLGVLITLTWGSVPGAATYYIQIDDNSDFSSPSVDQNAGAGTSLAFGPFLYGTSFHWRVKALDGVGGDLTGYSSAFSFSTAALTATSPANAATGVTLSPTLTWTYPGPPSNYDVDVATDAGFTSIVATHTGLTTTSQAIGPLTPNTTYYWRLRITGGGNYAATHSFTTATVVPTSPSNGATDIRLDPVLLWNDEGTGAASYEVQYDTDSGFSSPSISNVGSDTDLPISGPLALNTTYHWRVLAKNGGGATIATSATFSFTTANITIVSPANGAINQALAPTFDWTDSGTNLSSPDLFYHTDSNVLSGTRVNSVPDPHTLTASLQPNTTYYWQLEFGPITTPVFSFTTAGVSLTGPLNAATNQPLTPTFSWADPGTGAASYDLQYDTDAGFGSATTVSGATSPHTLGSTLQEITTYYWRVLAKNGGGATIATSATFSFSTLVNSSGNGLNGLPATAIIQAGAFTQATEAFVGTYGYGVYRWNPTTGWEAKNNGLTNPWIYGLVANGNTLYAGTWGNGIFVSTDNGDTWTQSGVPGTHVRGLAVNSSNEVYATGDFSEVWKLNGATWELVGKIAEYPTEPWGLAIDPGNANHLYAATRYGLFESTDGGVSWTQTIHGVQTFAVATHPTTRDVLVGTPTGTVRRTHGGTTFDLLRSSISPVYALTFDRSNRLYVGHWGPPGVEVSPDGGTTWTVLELLPPIITSPPEFASKSGNVNQRVVSVLVSPFDGTVIVSTDDGSVYVLPGDAGSVVSNDTPSELPTSYSLGQNYPNPFNPETVIGFEVPQASEVRVVVYDMLGRVVQVLHEGMARAGKHEVVFDAQNVPSGVYMYRMETNSEVLTRMMTLMK